MTDDLSSLHDELRSVARDMLGRHSPLRAGGAGPEPVGWDAWCAAGWAGLEVPPGQEGAGATFAETAVVLHEMGRAATAGSFLGSAVLAAGALGLLEATPAVQDALVDVATGRRRLAVALPADTLPADTLPADTPPADTLPADTLPADTLPADTLPADTPAAPAGRPVPAFRLAGDDGGPAGGFRLDGSAPFVVDASGADALLLAATSPQGAVLVAVEASVPGLSVIPVPVVDATRALATVEASAVAVPAEAVWRFADAERALSRLADRGALAVACDSVGVAEAALEATVEYAGTRHQFGRPIGSFQAVKHACADMLVQLEVARELVSAAVTAWSEGGAESAAAVSRAKSYACSTAVEVAGRAIQLHGGIGYTWENGLHVYLKRAALNRSLFGSPSEHRRRLIAGLAPPATGGPHPATTIRK